MNAQNAEPSMWRSAQAYGLSVICLAAGVAVGYLFHGPVAATVQNASTQSTLNPMPPGVSPAGMAQTMPRGSAPAPTMNPANGNPAQQQVTPEQMKTMVDKAAAPLLEKLKQNPNDVDLLAKTGTVYGMGRQFGLSEKYFERAIKIKPSALLYTDLATAYHQSGADDKSMESLTHALELDPKFANALFNMGVLKLTMKGDGEGAIALWEKLIKTNPDTPHRAEIEQMIARVKSGSASAKP